MAYRAALGADSLGSVTRDDFQQRRRGLRRWGFSEGDAGHMRLRGLEPGSPPPGSGQWRVGGPRIRLRSTLVGRTGRQYGCLRGGISLWEPSCARDGQAAGRSRQGGH